LSRELKIKLPHPDRFLEEDDPMNSPMEGTTFLYMWLGFLLLMICSVASFFLWAIRKGQFSRQDRARYLALQSGIPAAVDSPEKVRLPYGRVPS
jgi:nitrogen fixation-related uncharacterized protein